MIPYSDKVSFSDRVQKHTPEKFKEWFELRFEGDWKKAYRSFGGIIPKARKPKK